MNKGIMFLKKLRCCVGGGNTKQFGHITELMIEIGQL